MRKVGITVLGRRVTAVTAIGTGIVLVGSLGVASAANGGNFLIGKTNYSSASTVLRDSGANVPLVIVGSSTKAPLAVSSKVKVGNLNADLLDGLDSTQFQRKIPAVVWHALPLSNGWAAYGSSAYGPTPQYTKDAFGFVHLRGTMDGSSETSLAFATLPAGFRPSSGAWVPVGTSAGSFDPYPANVYIDNLGTLTLANGTGANNSFVSLEGVTFYAG
jgi:hypothetical protein